MDETKSSDRALSIFSALSDKTRLSIIRELLKGDKPCAELISGFGLSKSTFSHHAKVLARSGLVKFRREGKFLFFSLERDLLKGSIEVFIEGEGH
ncbi:DNA-binding transcriptional ArsR family regulator [Anaerobacterium chartisolvens]|uniref:DNA-binding transcriptional ArsR family regulator n=1 Tax=Anaerobacterium chartisolvens TaxID=1297424 RepID=A0A369AKB0_9FIRM|nr:metalloregulator ArsR/SmtB family transcription factor [Anaerobacterium chartisolvens]RCX09611.1 DNA-binding transcriptional ArsR family regulator [Anaerobacterium chartisolvens]